MLANQKAFLRNGLLNLNAKDAVNKEKTLYWILDLSPRSNWLILFCIPPLCFIYFFAVGNYLLEKTGKKNYLFYVAIFTILVLFCALPFVDSSAYFQASSTFKKVFVLSAVFSWFLSMITLSVITVNYERSLKTDYHFAFSDNFEYVKRFFVFGYFPFSIWSFQQLVNQYRKARYR